MKSSIELSLQRIKNEIDVNYLDIEAIKNKIAGLMLAKDILEDEIYKQEKSTPKEGTE